MKKPKDTLRIVMGVSGAALFLGFFLPWIDISVFGERATLSGFDMVRDLRDAFSTATQIFLALLPITGALLALAAFGGGKAAGKLAIGVGAGVLGYTAYKVAHYFLLTTGIGLWLILVAATVSLVAGVMHHNRAKAARTATL